MKHGYTHPATARRNELIRDGFSVIDSDISLAAMRKNVTAKSYPCGSVWLTTGEVLAPKTKHSQKESA